MKLKNFILIILFILPAILLGQNKNVFYERIYLQTDKQSYLAGELVWLKLITTTEIGKPLVFSKIGYVEILDSSTSLLQAKVSIKDGIGEGVLTLPTSISSGKYRIVAYTNYMRNETPIAMGSKNITVINTLQNSGNNKYIEENGTDIENNYSTAINTVSLSTDKNIYSKRSKVELVVNSLPKDVYTLSVAIYGEELWDTPNSNINTWKTNIHRSIKSKLSSDFLPEYEGHIITARTSDKLTGKPITESNLLPAISFIGNHVNFFIGKYAQDGKILFPTKRIDNLKEMTVSVLDQNNKAEDRYKVEIESPFITNHEKTSLPSFDTNQLDTNRLLQRSVGLQVLHSFMKDSINQFKVDYANFAYKPDYTYVMDEYRRFATMPEVITEFVEFVAFRKIGGKRFLSVYSDDLIRYGHGNSLVLLDGIPLFDHELIFSYDPTLLNRADIYFDRFAFGEKHFDGIIAFYTKNNDYQSLEVDKQTSIIKYEGTLPLRHFYSPIHDNSLKTNSRTPDFRHTLYWNPNIKIDNKEAISLPFYTSDLDGTFRIVVEGLTKEGDPIYGTIKIEVQ